MNDQMAPYRKRATAVVITTAMLSFISYWRAASLVLCDLASSAYYVGGIAERSVGAAAPWFVGAVMLFAILVRATYIESCGMFVRAGVYRVVKAAIGARTAKVAVSALIFDYILTGPISSVSAGQYLAGFINELLVRFGIPVQMPPNELSMAVAVVIILYFWRKNIIGIHESSSRAMAIMTATVVMVAILIGWSLVTLWFHPQPLPPITPQLAPHELGWLEGFDWARTIGAVGVIIALSHSVLAMSGEETLAQVYREIAKPKIRNMKRAAVIISVVSFCFTALCTFFAAMIIPDEVRPQFYKNLMSGLTMYLVGPEWIRLVFQGVVVGVGALLLAGACNTGMVGANSVLCRIAEDGVLDPWFRKPHRRFGTTYRIITMVAVLQVFTVLLCGGDVFILGEAYAFGVIWSFVTTTTSVLILRFKDKNPREWKVPGNIRIAGVEFPLTIAFTSFVLLLIGVTNLFTKTIATTWGIAFVILFTTLLVISEQLTRRRHGTAHVGVEQVNIRFEDSVTPESCGCSKQRRVLVAVRDASHLYHLEQLLAQVDHATTDVLVLSIDRERPPRGGDLEFEKASAQPHADQQLLTRVVAIAERAGTEVIPIVVAAQDAMFAIAKVAYQLDVAEIVLGRSEKVNPEVQMEHIAFAWGYLTAEAARTIHVRIIWPNHEHAADLS